MWPSLVFGPHESPGLHRKRCLQQRNADRLAFAGSLAMIQSGGDAICDERRGVEIDHGPVHDFRRIALKRADAGHALQDLIVARFVFEWTRFAESSKAAVDEPWIDLFQAFVIDSQTRRNRWAEIVNQDVG
jgi:hypothetical protein